MIKTAGIGWQFFKTIIMITINGIQFSDEFIASFKNVDDFLDSAPCKHFIERRVVTSDALKSFFNKKTGNENQGIQQQAEETGLSEGGAGLNNGTKRSNSRSAGNPAKQGPDK